LTNTTYSHSCLQQSDTPDLHPPPLRIECIEKIAYAPMLELQEQRHAQVYAENCHDTLFLLEHTPVVTTGRNTGAKNVLASQEFLDQHGIQLHTTSRGGDVTYHGPGQLVGYPILKLRSNEQDLRRYVFNLEEILIRSVLEFGIQATRIDGLRGIWVDQKKIAAIGVRISRWTTMHGFALNVNLDLTPFNYIIPCGLQDKGVTSMAALLKKDICLQQVTDVVVRHAAAIFKRPFYYPTSTSRENS